MLNVKVAFSLIALLILQ